MTKYINQVCLADATKTAWVFGAGASAPPPYDVPTQAMLLSRFDDMTRPGSDSAQAKFDSLKERVRALCKKVLPGLNVTDSELSLEEVFSSYELALTNPRSSRDEVEKAQEAIADLLEALRNATKSFGRGDANKWQPHARKGQPSPYAELLEKLVPTTPNGQVPHVLITFNYDVNLDRCLINMRGSIADVDVDYGFAFANGRCPDAPTFEPPRSEQNVLLLRPHGALNWVRCRACLSVFSTLSRQISIDPNENCYACKKQRMDYLLVHPSYFRSYDDPLLRIVWGRAYEELARADRWIFVGYSLPSADVHFRALLRDALRARLAIGGYMQIVLVGRGPDTSDEFKKLARSYEMLFPNQLRIWKPTAGGFSDFVSRIS